MTENRIMNDQAVIDKLLNYIVASSLYCPLGVEKRVRILGECVGLRKPGCEECLRKHIEDLKIKRAMIYETKVYKKS